MLEKLGGRKMIIGVLGLMALVILSYFKPESVTSQFVAGLLGIITAFNVANVTNTIKSLGQPTAEVITSSEEDKVNYLHLQSQIDTTTKQIDTLADIIQKSLLTKQNESRIINEQVPQYEQPVERAQVLNAESNRQAISQFLNRPIA